MTYMEAAYTMIFKTLGSRNIAQLILAVAAC